MLGPLTAGVALAGSVVDNTYSELVPFQFDRSPRNLEQRYTNEASEFVELDDVRVHYRDEGPRDGPVLVAIHGTGSSLHTWDEWVERLDGVRVVRLDMPGFGLTGPREKRHTLERIVETVGQLCDHLELSDVTVAGNSLGGGVAWRLSLERPDLVERLVLVDPGGASLLSYIARHYRTLGTDFLPRYATPRMAVRMLLRDAYGDTDKLTDDIVKRYYDLLLRSGNRRAVMQLASNYREDHFTGDDPIQDTTGPVLPSTCKGRPEVLDGYSLEDVSVPTLFMWGTEDGWLAPDFGRELAAKVEDSRFIAYEGVGHVPMEEAPAETTADLVEFLG
jgi:pimeloyl-ACP methyl ester carboxylesterase